jgi:hypothetical protein
MRVLNVAVIILANMHKLLIKPAFRLIALISGLLLILSACTVLGGGAQDATPTPLPTSSVPDLQVVLPQACLVIQQDMIRVDSPQGDLIAWSPTSDTLAYIASTAGSSWNVGELNLLESPKFDNPVRLATHAAGELSWAPDGSAIGFLGLRSSDNLYTIGLAYPDGRPWRDLFPGEAARTDDYSSQKAILKWLDTGRLRVLISCGMDCMQGMDIGVGSGLFSKTGNPIQRTWDMWAAHINHPAQIPSKFADIKGQLNWSPDEKRIAYVDGDGNAWIIESGIIYPLEIGQYSTAAETDWSYDSQYLAIQVDQKLLIFKFNCPG